MLLAGTGGSPYRAQGELLHVRRRVCVENIEQSLHQFGQVRQDPLVQILAEHLESVEHTADRVRLFLPLFNVRAHLAEVLEQHGQQLGRVLRDFRL